MKRFYFLLLISGFAIGCTQAQKATTITLDSTTLQVDTILNGLDVPWEIVWGPDDHIWFTERHGRVSRVNPESGNRKVILDIQSRVYQFNESGMLGMMLHPQFDQTPMVYVAYTYQDGGSVKERISRWTYDSDSLKNEEILINGITGNNTHDGCRFLLLPDNTVLLSTGDARRDNDSQDPKLLNGKILRMNLDGSIPSDNPIPNSYVWSWGLRNTQGLALGPNNKIYGSEHGPTSDDELNLLIPGRNFGWPRVEGFCNSPVEQSFCADSNVVEPLHIWTPTIAPSDLIWYDHPAIPEWRNTLLMTVLKNKMIVKFTMSASGDSVVTTKEYLKGFFGRLRDICTDGKGNIYLATNGASWGNSDPFTHTILKLSNPDFVSVKSTGNVLKPTLYPNPSHGGFAIKSLFGNGSHSMEISDAMGRILETVKFTGNEYNYNGNQLSDGVYLIRLVSGNEAATTRWIKRK